jgi:hypothetical protein
MATTAGPSIITTTQGPAWWGYAGAAAIVLAVGVEEFPQIGVPLTALIVCVMVIGWEGWST